MDVSIEVREVASSADREDFLRLPWTIYRDDPLWVPPLLIERRDFINPRKHPFYLHGQAALFLARREGQVVGRIMASDDPLFNQANRTNIGSFGLFECVNDRQVAQALFERAQAWLAARGRTGMRGPIDYSMNYQCGLLIEGFTTPPRVMMNHNPRYYIQLFESWGLTKAKDLYGWWYTDSTNVEARFARLADRFAARGSFTIRPIRMADYAQEIERVKRVLNGAFRDNWGFVPLTDAEINHMGREFRWLLVPEMALLAEVHGEPVGLSLTLPDLNEGLRKINGRLTTFGLPIGLARLWYHYRRATAARLIAIGVLPEHRRKGIIEQLILRTNHYGFHARKFLGAELGWTLEDNAAINKPIERVGGVRYKTYRIYERSW